MSSHMSVKSNVPYELFGRMNQKRRTREALKSAAAKLVRGGAVPTVAEVAEAALVSKSTAYRYFPTQEALLAEVALDEAVASGLRSLHDLAQAPAPAVERLDAVVRADHELVTAHEAAFRAALRAMLAPRPTGAGVTPRRPGNRLRYLAEALTPLEDELGPERLERLVAALSLCVGIESVLVTEDICSLPSSEAESIKLWAARAMLKAAQYEARAGGQALSAPAAL